MALSWCVGEDGPDHGALTGMGADPDAAAERLGPFPRGEQARTSAGDQLLENMDGIEAATVVLHA